MLGYIVHHKVCHIAMLIKVFITFQCSSKLYSITMFIKGYITLGHTYRLTCVEQPYSECFYHIATSKASFPYVEILCSRVCMLHNDIN